jgi:ribosomal protein S18 acetylase RimI-like enzyme
VRVRPARPEDAAAIAEVHVRTWQAAYEHVFGAERLAALDLATRVERWRRRLVEPERRHEAVLVVEGEEGIVGFASCGESRDAARQGELYAIYVLPAAWGSGAGHALMAAALAALRQGGFETASLWVLEDNPRAQRFYERVGWIESGDRREVEFLGVPITELGYRITLD